MANNTDWLNISPASGSSGQTVLTITAGTNAGNTNKTATVKAYNTVCGVTSMTYVVLHKLVPISYTADISEVDWTGETRTIAIDVSNLITSSIAVATGGTADLTYSYSNGVITVVFSENTGETRDATITVTGRTQDGDIASADIEYSQAQFGIIPYTADTSTVEPTGETRTITIDTTGLNVSTIGVEIEDATGATYSIYSGGSLIDIVFPNNTGDTKIYSVTITALTTGSSIVSAFIRFQQMETPNTYLTFNILTDGNIQWRVTVTGSGPYYPYQRTISYRKNNGSWSNITSTKNQSSYSTITVQAGDKIQFKGNNRAYGFNDVSYNRNYFASTADYECYGNILSLTNGDNYASATGMSDCAFLGLFYGSGSHIKSVKYLLLPNTTKLRCYCDLFRGCSSITEPPILPNSLVVSEECFESMFQGCTSLTTAPELPATTLSYSCYQLMFRNCTSLTTAPELPAENVPYMAYEGMFYGCTNLNYIKCLATTINTGNFGATYQWVNGVASTGTFVKNPNMSSWTTGVDGIPSGWTVQDAT